MAKNNLNVKLKKSVSLVFTHALLILISAFFLFLFFFMLFKSLMTDAESIGNPYVVFFPKSPVFLNYAKILDAELLGYFKNTMIVVVCNCFFIPLASALCAFGFSRIKFKTRNFWFSFTLSTLMLPTVVTQIPLYVLFRQLGLLGNLGSLIIPGLFGGGAVNIFLMRQFMRTIPNQMDEAAVIDGANRFIIFARLILPLCKPIILFVIVNTFMGNWNDFSAPLIYANNKASYTLALGLYYKFMTNSSIIVTNLKMALGVVMSIPVIILFMFMQKQLINGVVTTGLKI